MNLFNWIFNRNTRYYGHTLSLGYNCEVSFQFFLHHHFVESSLLAWANTINIDNVILALENPDILCTGKVENCNPMWKCFNTGICFHGKAPAKIWNNNPSQEVIKADKDELLSRIEHLKQKFIQTGCDGKKNLYIFKYSPTSDTAENIISKINRLYEVLSRSVNNQFDLLIITEQGFCPQLENLNNNPQIFIRRVNFFTPEEAVTSKKNDRRHWKRIWQEFRPNFKLSKTKKFKFEDL